MPGSWERVCETSISVQGSSSGMWDWRSFRVYCVVTADDKMVQEFVQQRGLREIRWPHATVVRYSF